MPRRIDIELTSSRDDDTWTWRAAGAKQPKGVLDAKLLYADARVGDVVRAEAEFEIDGITVTFIHPPKTAKRETDVLPLITTASPEGGVTTSLVPKSERPRPEGRRDRDRGGAGGGGRPPRPGGGDRGPHERGGDRPRPERTGGDRTRSERPRTGGGPRPEGGPRRERPARPAPAPTPAADAKPKVKRLNAASVHRNALLESLSPEQRPVAEQLLKGGIPAVRQAVEAQNSQARAAGQPEIPATALMGMAEDLLPRVRVAEWRDRAEAAAATIDDVNLRDLRSVVAGSDAAARDDETRALASTLRTALERRSAEQRDEWFKEMQTCLDDNRLVRALRISARPPDPSTRLPADLAVKLTEAANAAMAPDASAERWTALLEAVAGSPVRRSVHPAGLPTEPGEPLLHLARATAGKVPALAALLGIDMPPPPGPARPQARPRRPIPPRPVAPSAPAAPVEPVAEVAPDEPVAEVAPDEPVAEVAPEVEPDAGVPSLDELQVDGLIDEDPIIVDFDS